MLKPLFGEMMTGRLGRVRYLLFFLLISLLIFGVAFGIGAFVGITERTAGETIDLQTALHSGLGIVGIGLAALIFGLLFFAHLNIAAKRIRDIGLPGWWIILALVVLGVFASVVGGDRLANGVNLLIVLSLMILPTDSFGRHLVDPNQP